jgi:hypothetical protein
VQNAVGKQCPPCCRCASICCWQGAGAGCWHVLRFCVHFLLAPDCSTQPVTLHCCSVGLGSH